jgi:hypothetical protein
MAIEHVLAKLNDFANKDMLQDIDLARFLFGEAIPLPWAARE